MIRSKTFETKIFIVYIIKTEIYDFEHFPKLQNISFQFSRKYRYTVIIYDRFKF